MRKNRTKHEAKKPRLAKRALALCFALIFVCSCLLPAFANSEGTLPTDPLTMVEQKDEQQPEELSLLNESGESGENPTEGNEKQDEQKQEEPNASKETPKEPASSSAASSEASGESQSTAPSESASSEGSASTAPGESASSSSASSSSASSSAPSEEPAASSSASSEEPAASSASSSEAASSSASASSTVTSGDVINQGEAVYTYRFWTKEIDAFDLEQVDLAVKNGNSLTDAAKSVTGIAPCEVLKVANNAHLADYAVTEPTKSGYEFAGWYTLKDGTAYEFSFDQNVSFEESKTIDVFAKWNELVTLRETVNVVLGGEAVADEYSYEDDRMAAPTTLTLDVEATNLSSNSKLSVSSASSTDIDKYCDNNDLVPILTLDITPKDEDGKKTEPQKSSTVTISGLSELELPNELTMVHKKDDGIEEIKAQYSNGTLTFDTTSFSTYAVAVDLDETAKAKQIKKVNNVSIEDDTLNTGRFILKANITTKDGKTADYTGEEAGKLLYDNGYTITWNNGSDITYGRVILDNGKSVENSAQNGGWVNVSYTYPNGSETTKVTYTVTVKKDGVTIPNGSAREKTKYYKQLMNGSFEKGCTFQYDHGAPLFSVPYWNATQNDDLLEVIGTRYSPLRNYFDTDRYVRDEYHAVELNATNEGTLYQTVLTVPGQTLYWSFSHRARTVSISGRTGFDKMAMLIVPEALAEKLSENGNEYLRNWARGKGATATNGGFFPVDETDDNGKPYQIYMAQHQSEVTRSGWNYNSQWGDMSGNLTVPDDWYVVRFFFVAVETCSDSISVGNIVDAVSFSQYPPTFENYGEATVNVTKRVYGLGDLTEAQAKELLNKSSFIEGVNLGEWNRDTDSDGKVYYEASGTVTERMFSDKDVTYKEVFDHAQLSGYTLTGAKVKVGNGNDTAANLTENPKDTELAVNVTLCKNDTKNIVFTNTYTPVTTSLTVTKHVEEGNAKAPDNAEFKFKLTVGSEKEFYEGVTFEPGTKVEHAANTNVWEFTLTDGDSIKISGIRLDDNNVKVEEVINDDHYTTTNTVDGVKSTGDGKVAKVTPKIDGNTVEFTNTYNVPNLNSMTIKKVVTGAFGERTKDFTFSVKLDNDKRLDVIHSFSNPATTGALNSFILKHGEYVTLWSIPIDTTITITESNANDYDTKATNYDKANDKTFVYKVMNENGKAVLKSTGANAAEVKDNAITVTNDFDGTPDTGVLLDTLPYLILLAVAVAGGVLVVVRKRKHRDE